MTGRLLWYQILLIFISKMFKFCHNKNILSILNLLKLDFQPSTLWQNENAHRRHSFGGLPFSNDLYTEISREKTGHYDMPGHHTDPGLRRGTSHTGFYYIHFYQREKFYLIESQYCTSSSESLVPIWKGSNKCTKFLSKFPVENALFQFFQSKVKFIFIYWTNRYPIIQKVTLYIYAT